MTALIIVKRINYFSGPNTYLHVCGRGEVLLFLVTPKLYRVFHVGLILVLGDQIEKQLEGKLLKQKLKECKMSRYQVHDFYVNSQFRWLRFDCICESVNFCVTRLSKPNRRCAKKSKAGDCLRPWAHMTHCGSIMDSLPEVAFDHKTHRRGDEQRCHLQILPALGSRLFITTITIQVGESVLLWLFQRHSILMSGQIQHLREQPHWNAKI